MPVPLRYILSQGPMIAAIGRAAASGLRKHSSPPQVVPGPWIEAQVAPPPSALVRDYIRHVGGDPSWYRGRLPAHLFPQWGLPVAARALAALAYPVARIMNAGCRIESRSPLPAGERLLVRARIEAVDDDGRRAIITQRIVMGTRSAPEALVADSRAFIRLAQRTGAESTKRTSDERFVPSAGIVREIGFLHIGPGAGIDFAKLTGDFNPVHWLAPYARASGFRHCILHGFSTMARAIETLNRARLSGDPSRLKIIDARFTKPLVLPASVGIYVSGDGRLWVGDAPQGRAYLEARFQAELPS
jgi:acyl dehydratase